MRRIFAVPRFALVEVYPDLALLRDAALAGRWADVAEYLDRLALHTDVTTAVRMIAQIPDVETPLRDALNTHHTVHWLRTLLAARMLRLGDGSLVPRGYRAVTQAQRNKAHAEFHAAEELLVHVDAAEPENLCAATLLLQTGMSLGLDADEIGARYTAALKTLRHPVFAQHLMMVAMTRDEDLTYTEIRDFVLDCMADAPYGAMQGVLLADMHLRAWAALGATDRGIYFRQTSVIDDLRNASSRSVMHTAFAQPHGWVWAHNVFAMAATLAGDKEAARHHFTVLDMRASRSPWNLYREAGTAFISARSAALGWFR